MSGSGVFDQFIRPQAERKVVSELSGPSEPMSTTQGNTGHGWHLPSSALDPTVPLVMWYPLIPRTGRARVLRSTCECLLTVCHLVTGGGRGRVRRSVRKSHAGRPALSESEPLRYVQVAGLGEKILLGQVR